MKNLLLLTLFNLCIVTGFAQDKAIHYSELQKYLPSELMGYSHSSDPDGSSFEMNGMSYSTAIQKYGKGDSEMDITIIDYHGALTMYSAASMAWSTGMSFEDADQKAEGTEIDGFKGWQVYDKKDKTTQLMIGVKDRYLVTIETQGDPQFARSVFSKLSLGKLPE